MGNIIETAAAGVAFLVIARLLRALGAGVAWLSRAARVCAACGRPTTPGPQQCAVCGAPADCAS